MDSNQLEKERGITILSKYTSMIYKVSRRCIAARGTYRARTKPALLFPETQGHYINAVDTPGHADFGGESGADV